MKLKIAAICLAALALFAGCEKPSERAAENANVEGGQQYITIKGSDTMVHLVTAWTEKYMEKNPNTDISVTGGGSGTGIAAMINGTTDIAMSSRKFKEEEEALAKGKNIVPNEIITSLDGIAIVVNPSNPVNELTIEQLKGIYTGSITSWKLVGGKDEPITLLSRESNSGTYIYFQEEVLKKQDYAASAMLIPSSSGIIQSAEEDAHAIGYVGVAYAEHSKAKIVKVKATPEAEAVLPTVENIKGNKYPISRPLFLYTKGAPTAEVKKFIDFVMSPEGQALVKEIGYVPIS